MEMHYTTLLEAMADELGSADAIVFGDKRLSWSELDDRAARLAQVMLDAGIEPGDRIVLYTDGIEHVAPRIVTGANAVPDAIDTLLGTLACGDLPDGMRHLENLIDLSADASQAQDDLTVVAFEMHD